MSDNNYTVHPYYPHILVSKEEEWRPVVGYEDLAMVSNKGRVKFLSRRKKNGRDNSPSSYSIMPERITCGGTINKAGHLCVGIARTGEKKRYPLIHRLVLESFVGPCPENMVACHHPDNTPSNNNLENLRWDTQKENVQDCVRIGTFKPLKIRYGCDNGNSIEKRKFKELYYSGLYTPEQISEIIRMDLDWVNNSIQYQLRKNPKAPRDPMKWQKEVDRLNKELHMKRTDEKIGTEIEYIKHPKYENVMVPNTEVWKDIPEYENRYQCSTHGRLKSLSRYRKTGRGSQLLPEKIMKLNPNQFGYYGIRLHKDCKTVGYFIHRLVLMTFVGPKPENMFGLHIDGNPANNRIENLYWGTQVENWKDKRRHNTAPIGEKQGSAYLTQEQCDCIMEMYDSGLWTIEELAVKFNAIMKLTRRIVKRTHWSSKRKEVV